MKLKHQSLLNKSKIDREYDREMLWQVKLAYRLAFVFTVLSAGLMLVGIVYLVLGKISIGLVTAAIGLLIDRVSNLWMEFWRETKRGIDRDDDSID
jgi:hypothetical protein